MALKFSNGRWVDDATGQVYTDDQAAAMLRATGGQALVGGPPPPPPPPPAGPSFSGVSQGIGATDPGPDVGLPSLDPRNPGSPNYYDPAVTGTVNDPRNRMAGAGADPNVLKARFTTAGPGPGGVAAGVDSGAGTIDPRAPTDTSAFGADRAAAQAAYEDYLRQSQRVAVSTPTVVPSTVSTPGDVVFHDPGAIERVSSTMPSDVTLSPAARGATAQQVTAPTMGPAATTGAATIGAAQIDQQPQGQIRSQQLDYIQALKDRMSGRAPSVAEAQYNKAVGDIAQNTLGVAAQARGNDAAAARRDAIRNISQKTAEQGLGDALIRAQESATAAGQLGGALTDTRGTDVSLATSQAGLTQGANLANQGAENTVGMFNSGEQNKLAQYEAGLKTQVLAGNADRALSADTFSAGAQNARDQAVADVAAANANRRIGVATTDAGAANSRAMDVAKTQAEIAAQNINRVNQTNQFNATQTQGASTSTGQMDLQAQQIAEAKAANLRAEADAAAARAAAAASNTVGAVQNDKARVAGQENSRYAVDKQAGTQALAAGINAGATVGGAVLSNLGKPSASPTDSSAGGVGGYSQDNVDQNEEEKQNALLSDERTKTGIHKAADEDVDELLQAFEAKGWRYKDPANGEGERLGPMAQDIERTRYGEALVRERGDGKKVVDTGALTLALAAAVGRMRREMKGKKAA